MPEFSSSGIWDLDKENLMIDWTDLPINEKLEDEFRQWIRFYDTCWRDQYSEFIPDKAKELNDRGLTLARKMKKLLPDTYVEYYGEDETGMRHRIIIPA